MTAEAYRRPAGEVLEELDVDPARGLSAKEAKRRRQQYGPNQLREAKARSTWEILVDQFGSPIVWLLAVAAVVSFALGEILQGIAVALAILINAGIGFVTELRAVRSMEALRKLGGRTARVRRDGERREIPAVELVPGDLVVLEAGDIVPADLRWIEANTLQIDESALTGESVPVEKVTKRAYRDQPLADRTAMGFKGTAITRGSGVGVAVATGMETELGRIAELAEEAEEETTPLEKRLEGLAKTLIWLTLVIAAAVGVAGWYAGKDLVLMIETAVALAVAAVPEGLPIVATVALARGMWRMVRRNAVIEQLSAVETLGSTSVIFTDKTGTLTENRMQVQRYALDGGDVAVEWGGGAVRFARDGRAVEVTADAALRAAVEVGALCNNASLKKDGESGLGDPMEVGLLRVGRGAGMKRADLAGRQPEVREESFDSDTKMMATFHEAEGGYRVAVKGAPEAVLEVCGGVMTAEGRRPLDDAGREAWQRRNDELAGQALRVLALAERTVPESDAPPYRDLTLIGLVGLHDPPRGDVRGAVTDCRDAGIKVRMVTGDQPMTARSIAIQAGLADEGSARVIEGKDLKHAEELTEEEEADLRTVPVFARVSPKQKLDLIAIQQDAGEVVAMTGDGVNDAPALKKADVGVAMGRRGTEVAREAADMVLKDDAFPTIVAAIAQGRAIFDNIRRFIIYLLSGNLGEILAVGVAGAMAVPLPLLPLQILFINAILDVFPALALGVGKGDEDVMRRPPRDTSEPMLAYRHWAVVAAYGALMAGAILGSFFAALFWFEMEPERATTISFLTLGLARLWHVFNMRSARSGLFVNDVTQNRFVWGAIALCAVLLIGGAYTPGVSDALEIVEPGPEGWALIVVASLVPLVLVQLVKLGINLGARRG
jgi:Ca2+-transporting ATPase